MYLPSLRHTLHRAEVCPELPTFPPAFTSTELWINHTDTPVPCASEGTPQSLAKAKAHSGKGCLHNQGVRESTPFPRRWVSHPSCWCTYSSRSTCLLKESLCPLIEEGQLAALAKSSCWILSCILFWRALPGDFCYKVLIALMLSKMLFMHSMFLCSSLLIRTQEITARFLIPLLTSGCCDIV